MKYVKFLILGVLFGVMMSKAEIISWYRIFEMFRFESFHMYGVIGSAVVLGVIIIQFIKRSKLKSMDGEEIEICDKDKSVPRYLFGGIIFGLGWAMTGACPGPMFIIVGHGAWAFLIVILSALLGTFVYGLIRDKLPH